MKAFLSRTLLANLLAAFMFFVATVAAVQTDSASSKQATAESSTSIDLFVMMSSDFVRPGLLPRANYNIGIGHTFGFLKKDLIGDELTFSYTYENAGSHGFFHTNFGSHTEALGVMKNFGLPKTKVVTGYTWIQAGLTSFTGNLHIQNRFYNGESLGAVIHFNNHNSIWIQETYNKIPTVPWYTTSGIGTHGVGDAGGRHAVIRIDESAQETASDGYESKIDIRPVMKRLARFLVIFL